MARWSWAPLAAVLSAAPAAAQTTALFSFSGDAPADAKSLATAGIQDVLEKQGYRPVPQGAPIEDTTVVLGCSINEASCLEHVARTLEAEQLLFGALERSGDRLRLRVSWTTASAKLIAGLDETFAVADLRTQVATAFARALRPPNEPAQATLAIRSKPSPLPVAIDGAPAGDTPLDVQLPLGTHVVEVGSGAGREVRRIELGAEGTQTEVVVLDRSARSARSPSETAFDLGRVGVPAIVLTTAGAIALGAGVALAATVGPIQSDFDALAATLPAAPTTADQRTLDELDAIASRGNARSTLTLVALIAGGVALTAGVTWAIVQAGEDPTEPTLEAAVGPGSLLLGGHF